MPSDHSLRSKEPWESKGKRKGNPYYKKCRRTIKKGPQRGKTVWRWCKRKR